MSDRPLEHRACWVDGNGYGSYTVWGVNRRAAQDILKRWGVEPLDLPVIQQIIEAWVDGRMPCDVCGYTGPEHALGCERAKIPR